MHRFWDIRHRKMLWPWNPGHRSLKVVGTDTDRSATYDFLLTFPYNHLPISHRFRDKRWFQSKIANFSHPVYFAPLLTGSPWSCASAHAAWSHCSNGTTGLRKNLDDIFSRVDTIHHCNVTDGRTDGHLTTAKTALTHSVARVKIARLIWHCDESPIAMQGKIEHQNCRGFAERMNTMPNEYFFNLHPEHA